MKFFKGILVASLTFALCTQQATTSTGRRTGTVQFGSSPTPQQQKERQEGHLAAEDYLAEMQARYVRAHKKHESEDILKIERAALLRETESKLSRMYHYLQMASRQIQDTLPEYLLNGVRSATVAVANAEMELKSAKEKGLTTDQLQRTLELARNQYETAKLRYTPSKDAVAVEIGKLRTQFEKARAIFIEMENPAMSDAELNSKRLAFDQVSAPFIKEISAKYGSSDFRRPEPAGGREKYLPMTHEQYQAAIEERNRLRPEYQAEMLRREKAAEAKRQAEMALQQSKTTSSSFGVPTPLDLGEGQSPEEDVWEMRRSESGYFGSKPTSEQGLTPGGTTPREEREEREEIET